MKKLLFGLGILPLAALPVLTIVSCGTSSGEIGDGEIPKPDPETSTDLKITAIPSTQAIIDKAITNFNKNGITDTAKISALQTTFKGITSENFKNFEVKAIPTAGTIPGTITLTAKEGFSFGTQSSLTSNLLSDLKITAIPSTQAVIDKAIIDFNASGATYADKITVLSTIFTGITPENFKNIIVKATPTVGSTPGKITLTAKPGFTINGKDTLTSSLLLDLKITPIKVSQTVIDKSITDFKTATTDAGKISALQTTFTGITTTNLKNFDVKATPGIAEVTPGTIVLTAKQGFIFGSSKTLSSKVSGTNLDEEVNKFATPVETKKPTTLATEAANSIANAGDAIAKKAALELLVNVPILSEGFDFEVKSAIVNVENPTSIDVSITVTEKASSTTKNIIFIVTGLRGAPTLDEEEAKFSPTETKTKTTLATEAAKSIDDALSATTKREALELLVDLPTLSDGFTFIVTSANVNITTNTSIDVNISLIEQATLQIKDITFIVTGLKGAPTLDEEAAKFTPIATLTPSTTTTNAIRSINGAPDAAEKLKALKVLANVPTLSDGFTFEVKSAMPNTTTNTSIDVKIIVLQQEGSNVREVTFTITGLTTAQEMLGITAKPSTQTAIDQAIADFKAAITDTDKITALLTVFNGIKPENFANFDVTTPTGTPGTILLTAKPNFDFGSSNTLSSWLIIDLNITAKPSTQTVIDQAIANYKKAATNEAKIASLKTVFDGITPETFKNINKIEVIETTLGKPGTIELRPKQGYTFSGEKRLFSKVAPIVHLKISAIPSTQAKIDEAIKAYNDAKNSANLTEQLNALKLIFGGDDLIGINLANFDVTATPSTLDTPGKITLTAKEGYTINEAKTLSSELAPPTLAEEAAKFKTTATLISSTTTEAIKSINEAKDAAAKLEALKVLAKVPTLSNGFTFEVILAKVNATTPTSIDVSITVTETATSTTQEVIFTITGLTGDLMISAIPSTQTTIDKVIKVINIETDEALKIVELSKIFNGITIHNFKKINISTVPTTTDTPGTITLTAESGYTIGGKPNLSSVLLIDLLITATPSRPEIINEVIITIDAPEATEQEKITALSKIFVGITSENLKNLTIATNLEPGTIVLTANYGYTINGKNTLASHSITTDDLKITIAKGKIITQTTIDNAITSYLEATTDTDKITALLIVFDGITPSNFPTYFTVLATPTLGSTPGKIVLIAEPGYSFGLESTLTSMIVSNLEGLAPGIAPMPVKQEIIDQAITDFNAPDATVSAQIDALSKVFKAITPKNFPNFTVSATPTNGLVLGKITLTAKLGFIFGTSETLTSIINLPITAKPVPQQVIEDAILAQAPGTTDEEKILGLQTIFNGITAENFKYFKVDWHGLSGNQSLFLIPDKEFAFDGKTIIFSEVLPPTIGYESNIK